MTPVPAEAAKNTKNVAVNRLAAPVPGFQVAAVHAGIRYRDRPDLALIAADSEATAAGVFTRNQFAAAPVLLCREHLKRRQARAILVNAGIANACTGEEGLDAAREMAAMAARGLRVPPQAVLVASTGVIGPQIPLPVIERSIPKLTEQLRLDAWEDVARAIMTTDTVPKQASVQIALGGQVVTITGVAKGAGMIAPNMATLLVFVATDGAVNADVLERMLRDAADASFNRITIDGDTSTNDTLLVLASGRAGNPPISDADSEAGRIFAGGLQAVLLDLAKQIVWDGEGATKFIEVRVIGAADADSARQVAFTIANSPLVKTALFGEDANWGRVVAAAGRAGVPMNPARVALFFDEVCVFHAGKPLSGTELEAEASRVFKNREITIRLDLGAGDAEYSAYTCDLSYDYVKINASYRS